MKIIHIAGTSGSGKTTLVRNLIPVLETIGPVGVVKHIGHHTMKLEEGKDTTSFYGAGASISAGIDSEKMMMVAKETSLEETLVRLCDAGMQFAIVEGFKARPDPKIVIGEGGDTQNVLMTDPSVDEVVRRLDEFEEFTTAEGFTRELRRGCRPGMIVLICTLACPQTTRKDVVRSAEQDLLKNIGDLSGIIFAKLRFSGKIPGKDHAEIHFGVCATNTNGAIEAALFATDLLLPLSPAGEGET
ncbi:MAG: molybdopterin-guanine dinucleotide biosynthesis protein B [Methanoregulaceae archaeon]|nr:molybdopterin-guanine dinucleotide biosynthesis protein B [Methanoregulaceae archaeon]